MKNSLVLGLIAVGFSVGVSAQSHVPSLEASIQALSPGQQQAMESNAEAMTLLNPEIEAAVGSAKVAAALEQGLITEEQAQDLDTAISVIEANAEKFDFDIASYMSEALANGDISAEQAAFTLSAFDQLSEEAKAIVGSEDFDGNTDGFSAADAAIIESVNEKFGE